MEHVLTKYKIKPGKRAAAEAFLKDVHTRQAEMAPLLRECEISLDCSFVDGDFLFIFKKMKSPEKLMKRVRASESKIGREIAAWADECFESRADLAPLAVFEP